MHPQNQFRCSIPQCDHLIGIVEVLPGEESPCEPEVSNLNDSVFAHQNVPALYISVNDRLVVKVSDSLQDLLHYAFHMVSLKLDARINNAMQVVGHKLENQED